jgi:redox-regulated HSP33 family molecular chaperone
MSFMATKQVEEAMTPSGASLTKQITEFTRASQTFKAQLTRQITFHQEKK